MNSPDNKKNGNNRGIDSIRPYSTDVAEYLKRIKVKRNKSASMYPIEVADISRVRFYRNELLQVGANIDD